MPTLLLTQLPLLYPELAVFAAIVSLLMFGAFRGNDAVHIIIKLALMACLGVSALLVSRYGQPFTPLFNGFLFVDTITLCIKLVLCVGTAFILCLYWPEAQREKIEARFEFPILLLFALLGMMLLISSYHFLSFYMALELTSITLYILAATERDTIKSTEAGLKYFMLGALASGLILFGISYIYGFSGTLSFAELRVLSQNQAITSLPLGVMIGIVLVITGMLFKVAAAPFHMWAPDVYEGAPTVVTAFFATIAKVAAVAALICLLRLPFYGWQKDWQQIFYVVALLSMVVGSLGALLQQNFKRLLAYSAISHIGFILVGLLLVSDEGWRMVYNYLIIYVVMSIGVFAFLLMVTHKGTSIEKIDELAGLSRSHPLLALGLSLLMLSMAGIPPFAGFFAKLGIFMAAMKAGHVTLTICGLLLSVLAAYYYLRVIKVLYFDPQGVQVDTQLPFILRLVFFLSCVANAVYCVIPIFSSYRLPT